MLPVIDSDYEVIGLVGSFIISVGLVPQVLKVYRTKSAVDFSYSFLAMYAGGLGMTVLYGFGENLWPIYIPCSMEFFGALVLLVMKLVYDRETNVEETDEHGVRRHLVVGKPCITCNCTCGGVSPASTPGTST